MENEINMIKLKPKLKEPWTVYEVIKISSSFCCQNLYQIKLPELSPMSYKHSSYGLVVAPDKSFSSALGLSIIGLNTVGIVRIGMNRADNGLNRQSHIGLHGNAITHNKM